MKEFEIDFNKIQSCPTVVNGVHESCFRSYMVLNYVKQLLENGNSAKAIEDFLETVGEMPGVEEKK